MGGDGILNSGPLIFTGKGGVECEDWIQSIQREAFSQGKTNDKEWMASLASTRLSGAALRWYCTQSESTTSDWFRLRAALLNEYRPEPVVHEPIVATSTTNPSAVPTPAAAPSRSTSGPISSRLPAKSSRTANFDVLERLSSLAPIRPPNPSTAPTRAAASPGNTSSPTRSFLPLTLFPAANFDSGPKLLNSGSWSTGAPLQPTLSRAEIQSIARVRLSEHMNKVSSSASSQPVVSTVTTNYPNTAQLAYTGGYIKVRGGSGSTSWETYLDRNYRSNIIPSSSNSGLFFQFDLGTYEYTSSVSAFGLGPLSLVWNPSSYPNEPPNATMTSRPPLFSSSSQFYVKVSSLKSGIFEVYHGTTPDRLYCLVSGTSLIFTSNPELYKLSRAYQNVFDAELIYMPMNQ